MTGRGQAANATIVGAPRRAGRVRARFLAWCALAGVLVYVGVDVLLAYLRPGYSLLYNAESDYGRGPWYWVCTSAGACTWPWPSSPSRA